MKTKTIVTLKTLLMTILAGANLCVRPLPAGAQTPSDWSTPYETAAFSGSLELNDVYRTDRLFDANVFDPFNAASDPVFLSGTDFLSMDVSGFLCVASGSITPNNLNGAGNDRLRNVNDIPLGDGLWFLLAFTAFYALLAVVIRNPRPWVGKIKKIITLQFINS